MQPRRLYRECVVALCAVAMTGLAPGGVASADPASLNQVVQLRSLQDGHVIDASRGKLHRRADRISVKVATSELQPHEELDLLWAVFDNPSSCVHGNPVTGSPCGPADLFADGTGASLHFVAPVTADEAGKLSYETTLELGDTSGCIPGFPCGTGMTNPLRAEVHSVLFTEHGGRQGAQFLPPGG